MAQPPMAQPPIAARPGAEEAPPFEPGPPEALYQQPAPGAHPPFEARPAHVPQEWGFDEPAPGEPGAEGPDAGLAALSELGIDETDPSGPAPHTSLGTAAVPEPEPDAGPDDMGAEAEGPPGVPIVFGVRCKNGHFTDPDTRACVACGGAISRRAAAPQRGPRPSLGLLILDDGAAVEVDGDYIIGRDPARDPSVSAGEAEPLRVVDAESTVSRVHARVHLVGWQVLLTDLGSANGTRIQHPGAKSELLLEPQAPVQIVHGTRIFVGAPCLRFERAGANQ
jgi:hypothetical protein